MATSSVPGADNMIFELKGLVIDDTDVQEESEDFCWSLVGRFLTDKAVHFVSM